MSEIKLPTPPKGKHYILVDDEFVFDVATDLRPEQKAEVLIESLGWLNKFTGKIVVIKYGGNAMINNDLKNNFAEDIKYLKKVGVKPVIVHGGGPQISEMLNKLGIKSEFKHGLRVTTKESMDVVRMVLTGKVSRELVGLINTDKPYAVGISGEDAGLFKATKTTHTSTGEEVDFGLVGDIDSVDPTAVLDFLDAGRVPIISTVAPDKDDPTTVLNINADLAASALAASLNATKLIVLTDVEGIYETWDESTNGPDPSSLIKQISATKLRELLPTMSSGMIPKVRACLEAIDGGVESAHIIDGRKKHSLLNEIFTTEGVGTMIVSNDSQTVYGRYTARDLD
ncbi:MAG: acetylglutamate kinase [Bifidobacteriaceae bacterium]|jgi:acetylglutamate kinase|nr:acetylglutamate kinase [Bifidobacteriaceae bacterium]